MDFSFSEDAILFGLAERNDGFAIANTVSEFVDEPIRMFTADHFSDDYTSHSLYGVVNQVFARSATM